eukprot:EG_transcript_20227
MVDGVAQAGPGLPDLCLTDDSGRPTSTGIPDACPTVDQLTWAWESLSTNEQLQASCLCMALEVGQAEFRRAFAALPDAGPARALIVSLAFWLQTAASEEVEDLKYCLLAGHRPTPRPVPPTQRQRHYLAERWVLACSPCQHAGVDLPISDPACPHGAAAVVAAFGAAGAPTPLCVALRTAQVLVVRFAQAVQNSPEFWLLTDHHGLVRSGTYLAAQFAFGRLAWEQRYHHSPQGICHLRGYPILEFRLHRGDVEVVLPFRTAFEHAPLWVQRGNSTDLRASRT